MFLPLCISRRNGARVLEFIDGDAADYNAPILFASSVTWTRELAGSLWREIATRLPHYDVLIFNKMPHDVDGIPNPLSLLADRPNAISCHGSDLRRLWSEIDAAIPQRKTLQRKIRNLEKLAPLRFGIATQDDERQVVTAAFLRQKQWRFEQTRVPGFDVDLDKHDFFHEGTHTFAREGMVKLFYLKSGDTIIATIWGLVAGKRYYAIMLSFEAGEWARFSPGSILFYRALQWLHANNYHWMDLGIGDEAWKVESCETTFPLTTREEAVTLQGKVFLARTRMAHSLRATSAWQRVRPLKWVILRRLRLAA